MAVLNWRHGALTIPLLMAACTEVQVVHEPLIARSGDTITFTARAINQVPPKSQTIQILVNAQVVKTCNSSPCIYTGGPYPEREGNFVSYAANISSTYELGGQDYSVTDVDGYYFTGVTDEDYDFGGSNYLYGRFAGKINEKHDLVFHMDGDYNNDFEAFVSDAGDKIKDVIGRQDIFESNLHVFNFWVYKKEGVAAGCGNPHADVNSDMPWRDDDAVLHTVNFQDCANLGQNRFSAEGHNTKAFLHEISHAVLGLADEYDGPTHYFEPSPEGNIFETEDRCRDEQTAKGRDPDECYKFTNRSGGWWGIHEGPTVMTRGLVGDAWYTEGEERVRWFFDQF